MIQFNQYTEPFTGQDQYYITEISGLAMPSLRTPFDPVPLGDGILMHDFWEGAWHIGIEGLILVQSTTIMDDIVDIRNDMEADLTLALRNMLTSTGTFAFTPSSQGAQSFNVKTEIPVEYTHTDNYLSLQFQFGLIASP